MDNVHRTGGNAGMQHRGESSVGVRDLGVSDAVNNDVIAVVDARRLERECFLRSIELLHPRLVLLGYQSAADFLEAREHAPKPSAIILSTGRLELSDPEVVEQLTLLVSRADASPVVVLAEHDELEHMVKALDAGASGYIPASVGIDGIIEATRLAASGGIFLTTECLAKLRSIMPAKAAVPARLQDLTHRQAAVAEALRRGKANKTIAYDLNMCESTVKIHIRNIMRKLNATNRTEAAFKLNAILSRGGEA